MGGGTGGKAGKDLSRLGQLALRAEQAPADDVPAAIDLDEESSWKGVQPPGPEPAEQPKSPVPPESDAMPGAPPCPPGAPLPSEEDVHRAMPKCKVSRDMQAVASKLPWPAGPVLNWRSVAIATRRPWQSLRFFIGTGVGFPRVHMARFQARHLKSSSQT